MRSYPPRQTRTETIKISIFLTLSQLDKIAAMANRCQTKPNTFLQELIECALLDRQARTGEPNAEQRLQTQCEVMHSCLDAEGHSIYAKG